MNQVRRRLAQARLVSLISNLNCCKISLHYTRHRASRRLSVECSHMSALVSMSVDIKYVSDVFAPCLRCPQQPRELLIAS